MSIDAKEDVKMKCDELESEQWLDYSGEPSPCYPQKEVDSAIDEIKREHHRERDEYIEMVAQLKAELVEQESENRKTQRALWLARAERSASWQIHFSLCHNHSIEREFSINGASMPCEEMATMRTAKDWAMIWKKVERLCLKKAEEYK
jgi:exopolyphosphatase/pppGpp-phosphohydrolase